MRLVRLIVAGLVLGAVTGFVGALVRPRHVHPSGVVHEPCVLPDPLMAHVPAVGPIDVTSPGTTPSEVERTASRPQIPPRQQVSVARADDDVVELRTGTDEGEPVGVR